MLQYLRKFLLLMIFFSCSAYANLPYFPIEFPRDEAAHNANVPYPVGTMSEWWYYIGKLTSVEGRNFGFYLSYNYFQPEINGHKIMVPALYLQITDLDKQKIYGNVIFYPPKNTFFSTQDLQVVFGKEATLIKSGDAYVVSANIKSKQGPLLQFNAQFIPTRAPLLINQTGLTDMWNNTNSYYYSQTHLKLTNNSTIQIGDEKFTIDPARSIAWMDHQWGDFLIIPRMNQWLWDGIQLDNGLEINMATVLNSITKKPVNVLASIVMPDDSRVYTKNLTITPHLDPIHKHPLSYTITVPDIKLQLFINSLAPDQDVNGISEAISSAEGTFNGQPIQGYAYAECTVFYKH